MTKPAKPPRVSVVPTVTVSEPVDYFPHTDQGNASRFVDAYGTSLRYDHSGRSESDRAWLAWKTHWWHSVPDSQIFRAAVSLIERLGKSSANADFTKWMRTTESGYHLKEMIKRASMALPIAIESPQWDCDPMLLGVANGVIDLRTGKLRQGKPTDLIATHSPVKFDPDARCPTVELFLNQVLLERQDLIAYILKAGGYSLTGLTRERTMFILYGSGSNGKSKLLELLHYVIGGYGKTTPATTLGVSRANPDAPRNDLARLAGARFVTAHEAELSQGMAEAMVKWITGSDLISCRFGHGRLFEYMPQFKLWLSCNRRPLVRGIDPAIWKRLPLIPFEAKFDDETSVIKDDKELIGKLKAEASGFLNLLIQGCLDYQREGLNPQPECIRAASVQYRAASNPVAPFLDTCCEYTLEGDAESNEGETKRAIFDAYVTYMQRMREKPENINEFGAQMLAFGFTDGRRSHGRVRFWRNVSLVSNDAEIEVDG